MNFLPLAHNSISGTETALRSLIEPRFTFPGSKESTYNAGGLGSIPGSGRSPGGGNGYPHQYSCLRTPMDRGAWQAKVHGVAKELDMTEQLTLSYFHL